MILLKLSENMEERSGSRRGSGSTFQIFQEGKAEVEAERQCFHITVPNNQAAATAAT